MNFILLLGAGFSCNWHGWSTDGVLKHILGQPEIKSDDDLKHLLLTHKNTGGFENALAELQRDYLESEDNRTMGRLDKLQAAISRTLRYMNQQFFDIYDLEFQSNIKQQVRSFLVRFDAIFTLNQDLLLEGHYFFSPDNISLASNGKWTGYQFPGVERLVPAPLINVTWRPKDASQFRLEPGDQPYFKLHGSSNWRDSRGKELLVIGGDKSYTIASHKILKWYFERLEACLSQENTRFMVIGYGFRDSHINSAIYEAVNTSSLDDLFIIDTKGLEVLDNAEDDLPPNSVKLPKLGADYSDETLTAIFGKNAPEHGRVMSFFTP